MSNDHEPSGFFAASTTEPTCASDLHRSAPTREAGIHLPGAVANELTEVGFPQVALPVATSGCSNSILDDADYKAGVRRRRIRRMNGWYEPGRNSKGAA